MYDVNQVLSVAEAEVGYLEKASNQNLDGKTENAGDKNYTKYARDLDAIPGFYNGHKQGYAWCDVFVDWCFVTAYGKDAALKLLCQPTKSAGAGCRYSRGYFKAKGRLFDAPQPGDQIFFWPKTAIGGPAVQHTGLVYKVDSTYVYTIEGNTSGSSGVVANGGGVWKKKYRLDYNRIAGYGRPDYGMEGTAETPSTPSAPTETAYALGERTLRTGMTGADVKSLQEKLIARGYALPKSGADGEYGAETAAAVKAFQKDANLTADGVYGPKTHAALMQGAPAAPEQPETPTEPETPEAGTVTIVSDGGSVNIRVGNGTKYTRITAVKPGKTYPWVATAENGWHAIEIAGKVGWVSGEFSRRN